MPTTLRQAARRIRQRLDDSGRFLSVISENIHVDHATGAKLLLVMAETLPDAQGKTRELSIWIREADLTDAIADARSTDAIAEFDGR